MMRKGVIIWRRGQRNSGAPAARRPELDMTRLRYILWLSTQNEQV